MAAAFRAGIGYELAIPFPRLPYSEAMARYGCDKPDLRFGLLLQDVSDLVRDTEFKVFSNVLGAGGIVKGIAIPGGAAFSRKELDVDLLEAARPYGARGVAWLKVEDSGCSGAPAKFFTAAQLTALQQRLEAGRGDAMAFVADTPKIANASLAAIRNFLGKKLGLIKEGEFRFLWVTEFPAFEWQAEENRWVPAHHPFTAVHPDDVEMMMNADFGPTSDLGKVRSSAYDLVLNGVELASGSVRVHDAAMQRKIFQILRLSDEEMKERFGFFIEALSYGTPPHAGIAPGIDRLVAMMLGYDNIREVIAFPKNAKAVDLMTEAPGAVSARHLRELGIRNLER